ncbi:MULTISPECIES: hypothetical protein [unclassified Mycobacterium]|uniref:hypothetical protein n=1 Tax=unclassified Mycobacterium TaxID=2642494 RepID=UPI00073FB12F|nr:MULTISPECIES: hypothetical protein [unclassified Mycobacterium]KUH86067.1 pyridine nucleotide-disulfide oxidoreductase [Mycobacterium sp. IS-1556]KUH92284.1 pyridine nucleotide-disulfide oxidoreductase [Mycobacterium sp. GA-1999]KUI02462.1 pyridine nucleotide-disulfide oxidoreductase [Mycobacterium sp. IS-3022]
MISAEDVRALLRSEEKDAVLVVIEGRVEVIGAGRLASADYRGALEVVSRDDLVKRIGETPSDHEIDEQAAQLDTAVSELGG